MNEDIQHSILMAVQDLIANSTASTKIQSIADKHAGKVHFIPGKYRILGGLLQSMNIQFGNFLESVIANIVALDHENTIIDAYSGRRSRKLRAARHSFELIDQYLDDVQAHPKLDQDSIRLSYTQLLERIVQTERDTDAADKIVVSHDIDLLFNRSKQYFIYAEIKYNDDHDTGKFVDINRKLLKTYALLVNEFEVSTINDIKPVLMYFNDKLKKINPYLPEHEVIYRGSKFFSKFTDTDYKEIEREFSGISESQAIIREFDLLTEKILGGHLVRADD